MFPLVAITTSCEKEIVNRVYWLVEIVKLNAHEDFPLAGVHKVLLLMSTVVVRIEELLVYGSWVLIPWVPTLNIEVIKQSAMLYSPMVMTS